MKIELLYWEIHLKRSFATIPPDSMVHIECGKVIFMSRECVRSYVSNKMVKQSETPTKSLGKKLFGGTTMIIINVCVLWERAEHPRGTGTRKVIELNLKNLTSQWDLFLCFGK